MDHELVCPFSVNRTVFLGGGSEIFSSADPCQYVNKVHPQGVIW